MILAGVYYFLPHNESLLIFGFLAVLTTLLDIIRKWSEKVNDVLVHIFRPVMRQTEVSGFAGITFMMVGVFIVTFFFPREISLLTLFFLALGDPLASYFGIRYGKDKIWGEKSLQGTMAAFFACTAISFIYYYLQNIMTERLLVVGILSGLSGAMAELLPIGKLDDNLSLPVLSASALWMIFWLFGGLS